MLSVPEILSPDFDTNLAKIPALLNRGVSAVERTAGDAHGPLPRKEEGRETRMDDGEVPRDDPTGSAESPGADDCYAPALLSGAMPKVSRAAHMML